MSTKMPSDEKKQAYVDEWGRMEHDLRRYLMPISLYYSLLQQKDRLTDPERRMVLNGTTKALTKIEALNREMERALAKGALLFGEDKSLTAKYTHYLVKFTLFKQEATRFSENPSLFSKISHLSDTILMAVQEITLHVERKLNREAQYRAETVLEVVAEKKRLGLS